MFEQMRDAMLVRLFVAAADAGPRAMVSVTTVRPESSLVISTLIPPPPAWQRG
jgi:hypothetical protein